MNVPSRLPSVPRKSDTRRAFEAATSKQSQASGQGAIEPAGCCLEICTPFNGCRCVLDLPVCP
jgi:hypothetical protein